MTQKNKVSGLADRLQKAEKSKAAVPPFGAELNNDLEIAYAIQEELTKRRLENGDRLVGRKVGLTSKAVQIQLGVDQPDYGALFSCMEVINGEVCSTEDLIQPKVEAEIAVVLKQDLLHPDITTSEVVQSIDFLLPALEIVDSRVADWKIGIADTIADNGSSARYVLGQAPQQITQVDIETCGMVMTRNGEPVSVGSGAACLGNPLNALMWLAKAMARAGTPLRAGDVVLTGALGPMCPAEQGDVFEARISGFSPVSVRFG